MENISEFSCENKAFKKYMKNTISKIVSDNNLVSKDDVIYISSPMTGVNNYQERFDQLYKWVEYIYRDRNSFIINPSIYIDAIPKELNATYIDIMYLCFELLDLCGILIVDDSTPAWKESRGVLSELSYAKSSGDISIYGFDYIKIATITRKFLDGSLSEKEALKLTKSFTKFKNN